MNRKHNGLAALRTGKVRRFYDGGYTYDDWSSWLNAGDMSAAPAPAPTVITNPATTFDQANTWLDSGSLAGGTSPEEITVLGSQGVNPVDLPYTGYTGFSNIFNRGAIGGFSGEPSYFDVSGMGMFVLPDGSYGTAEQQMAAMTENPEFQAWLTGGEMSPPQMQMPNPQYALDPNRVTDIPANMLGSLRDDTSKVYVDDPTAYINTRKAAYQQGSTQKTANPYGDQTSTMSWLSSLLQNPITGVVASAASPFLGPILDKVGKWLGTKDTSSTDANAVDEYLSSGWKPTDTSIGVPWAESGSSMIDLQTSIYGGLKDILANIADRPVEEQKQAIDTWFSNRFSTDEAGGIDKYIGLPMSAIRAGLDPNDTDAALTSLINQLVQENPTAPIEELIVTAKNRLAQDTPAVTIPPSTVEGIEEVLVTAPKEETEDTAEVEPPKKPPLADVQPVTVVNNVKETEDVPRFPPDVVVPPTPITYDPNVGGGASSGLTSLAPSYKKNWGTYTPPPLGPAQSFVPQLLGYDTSSGMSVPIYAPGAQNDYLTAMNRLLTGPQTAGLGGAAYAMGRPADWVPTTTGGGITSGGTTTGGGGTTTGGGGTTTGGGGTTTGGGGTTTGGDKTTTDKTDTDGGKTQPSTSDKILIGDTMLPAGTTTQHVGNGFYNVFDASGNAIGVLRPGGANGVYEPWGTPQTFTAKDVLIGDTYLPEGTTTQHVGNGWYDVLDARGNKIGVLSPGGTHGVYTPYESPISAAPTTYTNPTRIDPDYIYAKGGLASLPEYRAGGKFLSGPGDGMSDDIRANINGEQEARLADGEFVVPADVVSHIGNGSSKAGAEQLYSMMDRIRKARTKSTKQAPPINARKHLPA